MVRSQGQIKKISPGTIKEIIFIWCNFTLDWFSNQILETAPGECLGLPPGEGQFPGGLGAFPHNVINTGYLT
jgi:hypothetical protein